MTQQAKKQIAITRAFFDELVGKAAKVAKNAIISEMITDNNLRLDDSQMQKLAQITAKDMGIALNIDYDRIKKEVLSEIPIPKDGRDLTMNDAMRADLIESAAALIPIPKNGEDGQDGKNYVLTENDRIQIARQAALEFAIDDIIIKLLKSAKFMSREELEEKFRALSVIFKRTKSGGGGGALTGWRLINEIDKVLGGTAWRETGVIQLGDEFVDQSFTNASTIPAPAAAWQSFTAGYTGYLTAIDIKIVANRPGNIFRIYSGEGIDGAILHQSIEAFSSSVVKKITVSPLFIEEGRKYTIYQDADPYNVAWPYNPSGGYPGGHSSINPSWDHYFTTYMKKLEITSA